MYICRTGLWFAPLMLCYLYKYELFLVFPQGGIYICLIIRHIYVCPYLGSPRWKVRSETGVPRYLIFDSLFDFFRGGGGLISDI